MATIHETKYLIFSVEKLQGKKTKLIRIINKSSYDELGTIEWYGAWRQYCFIPTDHIETVWNNDCLTDIIFVINKLMKEREVNKPDGE